ncbi:hypothetical protein AX15_001653 [Amanita polypyramis BW_CC]|nr:hypothetical protein AX15_001653 [Amanita polypyramis BW_CC]
MNATAVSAAPRARPVIHLKNFKRVLIAPLSKLCKKAIPGWIKRKVERRKADKNDWSFKDNTLPLDEKAMLDIADDNECQNSNFEIFKDSVWFEDASQGTDHDDSSDSLEAYINDFIDENFFKSSADDEDEGIYQ